jgi:hypothetical protein
MAAVICESMAKKNHQLITNRPPERVALVIQYAGSNLCGWQKQPFGRTVQSEIERAIEKSMVLVGQIVAFMLLLRSPILIILV